MPSDDPAPKPSAKSQLGILFTAKNILKTFASQVPVASAGVEMLNQLDGEKLADRVAQTEQQVKDLAARPPPGAALSPNAIPDWSYAAGEYTRRIAHFAVAYDGAITGAGNAARN
jgi:hypothetical protein